MLHHVGAAGARLAADGVCMLADNDLKSCQITIDRIDVADNRLAFTERL